jgi:pilus assembly protein Flp/PilA
MKVIRFIGQLAQSDEGVTAIEYGLIAALIAVAIIVSVTLVGSQLALVFAAVSTALSSVL